MHFLNKLKYQRIKYVFINQEKDACEEHIYPQLVGFFLSPSKNKRPLKGHVVTGNRN